jgi:single-strand DNA-binding protein
MKNPFNYQIFSVNLTLLYYLIDQIFMAFSLNRAQLIGNLTRDPEVRVAGTQKVATFGVATSLSWTDQTGQKKEKTEFHSVVAWRKLAEICEQYLRKGQKVYIEGRMQTRDWEGEDGVKRYKTEIVAENMIMLGKKGESTPVYADAPAEESTTPTERKPRSVKAKEEVAEQPKEQEVSIDDLPF